MIVSKAVKMAELMEITILGLVENMSFFQCPDNGVRYNIFGDSHVDEITVKHDLRVLARLPLDSRLSMACDQGAIEDYEE